MGIRMDQFEGLCAEAKVFLKENEVPEKICECCKRPFPRDLEIIGHYQGMSGDEYPLYRHRLKNGNCADEFLQATPWSSGPMFFLGLRLPVSLFEFKWSEIEIEERSV